MEIRSQNFEAIQIKAHITARDDGEFYWKVYTEGSSGVTPASGCTIFVRKPDDRHGISMSAHSAEMAASDMMTRMGDDLRKEFADAEARLATRNANHEAAQVANARLAALA